MNNLLKYFLFLCCGQSLFCSQAFDLSHTRTKTIDSVMKHAQAIEIMQPSLQREEKTKALIETTAAILRENNGSLEIQKNNRDSILACIDTIEYDIHYYKSHLQLIDNGQVILPLTPAQIALSAGMCFTEQKILALQSISSDHEAKEFFNDHNKEHVYEGQTYTYEALMNLLLNKLSQQKFDFDIKKHETQQKQLNRMRQEYSAQCEQAEYILQEQCGFLEELEKEIDAFSEEQDQLLSVHCRMLELLQRQIDQEQTIKEKAQQKANSIKNETPKLKQYNQAVQPQPKQIEAYKKLSLQVEAQYHADQARNEALKLQEQQDRAANLKLETEMREAQSQTTAPSKKNKYRRIEKATLDQCFESVKNMQIEAQVEKIEEEQYHADQARNEALKLQEQPAEAERLRLKEEKKEEAEWQVAPSSKKNKAVKQAIVALLEIQDQVSIEPILAARIEEDKKKQQQAEAERLRLKLKKEREKEAQRKAHQKKKNKTATVEENLEFLNEAQAQVQQEQAVVEKTEEEKIQERISTMTYQRFCDERHQNRLSFQASLIKKKYSSKKRQEELDKYNENDPYTHLKPEFEEYKNIVCGPITPFTLQALEHSNYKIAGFHKILCSRDERISWYFALDQDLKKCVYDRFKEFYDELEHKDLDEFKRERLQLEQNCKLQLQIIDDLKTVMKVVKDAGDEASVQKYLDTISIKINNYKHARSQYEQSEIFNVKIHMWGCMNALLREGGLLNSDRLFASINIDDWNTGVLSQEFLKDQFSIIDTCIDTVKKSSSPDHSLEDQLNLFGGCVPLSIIDSEVLPVIQNILITIGWPKETSLDYAASIIEMTHNHAANYVEKRLDLENLDHYTFCHFQRFNEEKNSHYSQEQLNDLRKIQIMLIKSYAHFLKKIIKH